MSTENAGTSEQRTGKVKKKRENPVKRWCFTLNNYNEDDLARLTANLTADLCDYAIVGKELSESGTPHLQGFVNLKKKLRLAGIKTLISERAHYEPAKGTDQDNKEYCSKGGDIHLNIGEPSTQGKRTDLKRAVDFLKTTGGDLSGLALAEPTTFIRYGRGLSMWVDFAKLQKPRDWKTELHVITGEPGCGKSRLVHGEALAEYGEDVYYKTRGDWWDGYVGQQCVIIDDFYGWMKYDELLRISDRYPHRVPIKGGFVQFIAKKIYITSNADAWTWYKFERFNAAALMRRVTTYRIWDQPEFKELRDTPVYNPTLPYNY